MPQEGAFLSRLLQKLIVLRRSNFIIPGISDPAQLKASIDVMNDIAAKHGGQSLTE